MVLPLRSAQLSLRAYCRSGQHALVLAGLIEDALHEAQRIEGKSDLSRRIDDGAFQLGTKHLAEKDLPGGQQRFDLLMAN